MPDVFVFATEEAFNDAVQARIDADPSLVRYTPAGKVELAGAVNLLADLQINSINAAGPSLTPITALSGNDPDDAANKINELVNAANLLRTGS